MNIELDDQGATINLLADTQAPIHVAISQHTSSYQGRLFLSSEHGVVYQQFRLPADQSIMAFLVSLTAEELAKRLWPKPEASMNQVIVCDKILQAIDALLNVAPSSQTTH